MSIQPNRVIHRIVDQVDQSDWPVLPCRLFGSTEGFETLRVYRSLEHSRYATPIHFWVHALRDELAATERRSDLVGAAGHALCRNQPLSKWLEEVGPFLDHAKASRSEVLGIRDQPRGASEPQVYRMLESECRRSSVFDDRETLCATFWGHGAAASWRRRSRC